MSLNTIFDQLVYKYLEGKLESHEYEEFMALLQSDDNYSRFEYLKQNWIPSENKNSIANWQRFSYRLAKIPTSTKRVMLNYWQSGVAAIFIVGLLVSTFYFYQKSEAFIAGSTVIKTPRGEKSNVQLPDGTEVWLNGNSTISYQSFSKANREVQLEGEAYFKVKHQDNIPFTVTTSRCQVKVLGTEFNVMAYEMFNRNEVTLFKGSVELKTEKGSSLLKVGQRFIIDDNGQYVRPADLQQTFCWVENKFDFHNIPFEELIMRLENWYDVDIEYNAEKFANSEFSGTFKNEETIWQILDVLKNYISFDYHEIDNRRIQLSLN
jgi:ferric-dicitrate binding protein FerR (iron transport regulator)